MLYSPCERRRQRREDPAHMKTADIDELSLPGSFGAVFGHIIKQAFLKMGHTTMFPAISSLARRMRLSGAGFFICLTAALLLFSTSALSEGTRSLHPAGATGNRAVMDVTGNDVFAGVARARQFLYVYAEEGEVILLGSINVGNDDGDIHVFNPQTFGSPVAEHIPVYAVCACLGDTSVPG